MNKDILKISTNGILGDVWSLEKPGEISIEYEEPLRKSLPPDIIGFIAPDLWTVVLVLNSVPGIKEWVTNKVYDIVFDYLKSAVKTKKMLPPKISLTVRCTQSDEVLNVNIEGNETSISTLHIDLKTKYTDGSEKKMAIKFKPK